MMTSSRQDARRVGLAVLLIGLGWLFLTGYWWPGLLFVIGFTMIAQGIAEGRGSSDLRTGLLLIAIGTVFAFGVKLWLLLILAGLALLFVAAVGRPAAT